MFSTCTIRDVVPFIRSFVADFKPITDLNQREHPQKYRRSKGKQKSSITDNRTNENSEQTRLTKS